ncbi:hypothetical protein OL239_09335 [Arthrobacter sp. ATA002]|nr:hypothetical protein [Arthrobacter sp. ATA002]WAP53218.1 hypothetical protein OL239_09335 [Arthrobacter sp. ATA002]
MVRTVYYVAASLDGFLIDAQNHPDGLDPGSEIRGNRIRGSSRGDP